MEMTSGHRTNLLAAAGKMKEIRLLHPEQLVCYAEMKGHKEEIACMVFHPNKPTILFSGDSKVKYFSAFRKTKRMLRIRWIYKEYLVYFSGEILRWLEIAITVNLILGLYLCLGCGCPIGSGVQNETSLADASHLSSTSPQPCSQSCLHAKLRYSSCRLRRRCLCLDHPRF